MKKQHNYKLIILNRILRAPFVLLLRLLAGLWATLRYVGKGIVHAYRAIFNAENARRIRKAYQGWQELMRDTGDWLINVLVFHGKVGAVIFQLDEFDPVDGTLQLRKEGDVDGVEIPFRIENRWLTNGKLMPSGLVLNQIMSQAIEAGYKVAHVTWQGRRLMPYYVAPLTLHRYPGDVEIPSETKWTEAQVFDEYEAMSRNSNIVQRF